MKSYPFLLPATLKPYFLEHLQKRSHDICWIVTIHKRRNERATEIYWAAHHDQIMVYLYYMRFWTIVWKYNRWERFLNHEKGEGFHMNKKLIPLQFYMPLCQALFTVLSFWITSFSGKDRIHLYTEKPFL